MIKHKWKIFFLAVSLLSIPFIGQAEPTQQECSSKKVLPQRTEAERAKRFEGAASLWLIEGRKLYKSSCKSCHHRDNDVGASCFSPESKTQKYWDLVFEQRYSKCAKDGSWDSLTATQLRDINDFLFRYAFGTEEKYVDPYR